MNPPLPVQRHLGPIKLSPGVTPTEIVIFLLVAALAGAVVSFCSLMQPFVYGEILNIPANQQGRIGGLLAMIQQAMVLIFIGFAGALADRWGRKFMLFLALMGFAIAAAAFPLVGSLAALIAVRAFFGLSQNGHTAGTPTKMFDYPDNGSRGKFMALVMICLNLMNVVLVGLIGSRLPSWLGSAGLSPRDAGRGAFWIVAAVALIAGLICIFCLQPDRKPRVVSQPKMGLKSLMAGYREVYQHAKTSPAFALIMVTGFVIRTDTTVLQAFLGLWVVHVGHQQGLSTIEALKIAGALTAIQSASFLIIPPIFGVLIDRVSRVVLYAGSMGFVGVAMCLVVFVTDVTSWPIYVVMGLIGLSEAAQTITQQALFGQEAPPHLRGTAYGVFAFTGTFSVVVVSGLSGLLFDRVGPTSPFVLIGILHIVFLAIALALMKVQRRRLAHSENLQTEAPP